MIRLSFRSVILSSLMSLIAKISPECLPFATLTLSTFIMTFLLLRSTPLQACLATHNLRNGYDLAFFIIFTLSPVRKVLAIVLIFHFLPVSFIINFLGLSLG